ncbi:MAG: potassium/proton antiporter [Oligoflexus sp.]
MTDITTGLLAGSLLLLISILLSKASGRLGLPALLVFMCIGMAAGSEGLGGIHFDNYLVAQAIGIVALVIILFDGGLTTHWDDVKPIVWRGLSLSTLGVFFTAFLVGCFVKFLLDLNWLEAILFGAIASSTDAAAVFSILRSKNAHLKGNNQALLELESGSNDPMAVFLTIGLLSIIGEPDKSIYNLIPMLIQQVVIGSAMGYAGARVFIQLINRIRLQYEGLYPVLMLAAVLVLYSSTTSLGGSGFLAVYLAGLILSRSDLIHKKTIIRFQDGLAWIMQIGMFLTLGLLVFPSELLPVAGEGLLVALWLIFIARPLSVFLSLALSDMSFREKLLVSWVGLRGATPIILATFPLLAGLTEANLMFNLVFFTVLISVLLQGMTIPIVANLLKLSEPGAARGLPLLEFTPGESSDSRLVEIRLAADAASIGKQIVDLSLPIGALIALITRRDQYIVPRGDTQLEAGDNLMILASGSMIDEIKKKLVG